MRYLLDLSGARQIEQLELARISETAHRSLTPIDVLEEFADYAPKVLRPAVDVMLLDRLECLPHYELSRLVSCVRQIIDRRIFVVVLGKEGPPMELMSFREVVSSYEYLSIMLRDMIAKTCVPPSIVTLQPEETPAPKRSRRVQRSKAVVC